MARFGISENLINRLSQKMGIRDKREKESAFGMIPVSKILESGVEVFSSHSFSEKEQALCEVATDFCRDLTTEFRDHFQVVMNEYRLSGGRVSLEMIQRMRELGIDTPVLQVHLQETRERLLEKYGFENFPLAPESALVLFDLPKPLSQYWWKSKYPGRGKVQGLQGMAIEWGDLYTAVIDRSWKVVEDYSKQGFDFHRVNQGGKHEPLHYYYIWEILPRTRSTVNTDEHDYSDDE